jgi:hypothetical protein
VACDSQDDFCDSAYTRTQQQITRKTEPIIQVNYTRYLFRYIA